MATEDSVNILLFEDISNMKEIKDLLLRGELQAAVINCELVYHPDQILLSSYRCLYNARYQQLKTRSVYTELLYCLFPSRSIRDALKTFGAQETSTSAIFVAFGDKELIVENLKHIVKGRLASLEKRIPELQNVASIRKLYKVSDSVKNEDTVLQCILTKMASKELLL